MTALSALQMEPHDTGRAWIEINREALRQNVEALRALLPPRCELMAVVKANAYGTAPCPWRGNSTGWGCAHLASPP